MPELPEVETIRRGLEQKIVGRTITSVEVRAPKIFQAELHQLIDRTITHLDRNGKLLVFRLDNGDAMTIHLKMTGQLIWKAEPTNKPESDLEDIPDNAELPLNSDDDDDEEDTVMGGHPQKAYLEPLPHKHTHIIFSFDNGSVLYFNDLRKFGRVQVLSPENLENLPFLQKLGPEPLSKDFTADYLANQLKKRSKLTIKAFLLDQSNLAGLGNIYADESLFRAAILPDRVTFSLKPGEVHNLYDAIQETLELALLYGGSSEKDYLSAVGEKGTYLKVANVYHRTGLECHRCLVGLIQRKKIAGRSTHYCLVCQH